MGMASETGALSVPVNGYLYFGQLKFRWVTI